MIFYLLLGHIFRPTSSIWGVTYQSSNYFYHLMHDTRILPHDCKQYAQTFSCFLILFNILIIIFDPDSIHILLFPRKWLTVVKRGQLMSVRRLLKGSLIRWGSLCLPWWSWMQCSGQVEAARKESAATQTTSTTMVEMISTPLVQDRAGNITDF